MKLGDLATRGGGAYLRDGVWEDAFSRRCEDCRTSFQSFDREGADRLWWEHVRDSHPNAFSVFILVGFIPSDFKI